MNMPVPGIAYTAAGLVAAAYCIICMKRAVDRTASSVSAFLLLFTGVFFLGAAALLNGEELSVIALWKAAPYKAAAAALCIAFSVLFWLRAFQSGSLLRVLPFIELSLLLNPLLSRFSGSARPGLFSVIYLLLLLLGFVFMISGSTDMPVYFWFLSVSGSILFFLFATLTKNISAEQTCWNTRLSVCIAATIFLLLLSLIGGAAQSLDATDPASILYAPAAACCIGTALLCITEAAHTGFSPAGDAITFLFLPVSALLGRIMAKDRASVLYPIGLVLFTVGAAALLLRS